MSEETPFEAAVHQMRSQLSVLRAVVDDLHGGFQLSAEDISDAKSAVDKLESFLKTLNTLEN